MEAGNPPDENVLFWAEQGQAEDTVQRPLWEGLHGLQVCRNRCKRGLGTEDRGRGHAEQTDRFLIPR